MPRCSRVRRSVLHPPHSVSIALWPLLSAAMESTGRMFLCAACRIQVVLCRRCDRGQIYCGRECSGRARRDAQRAAARRYQATRRGRFAHAERARRYRARCKIVTHQGSRDAKPDALLALQAAVSPQDPAAQSPSTPEVVSMVCKRCGAPRAAAVRLGFLRHHAPMRGRRGGTPGTRSVDEHWP